MFQRAIVTGASGFIGSHLVDGLLAAGVEVLAIDRRVGAFSCEFIQADVSIRGVLDGLLDHETVVFHLAANASVPGSVENPEEDFRDNTVGVFQVLESARRAGCKVVFTSSAAVLNTSNALPLAETAFPRPSSPYGAAKLAGEAYCAAYHRCYGLDVKIARLFNIYGPGMVRFAMYDFVKKIKRNPHELQVLGDGRQTRDYLYVEDAVRALLRIAECGEPGEDYNVASGNPVTMMEVAQRVACLMGCPDIRIVTTGKSWPGDIACWYADVSKLKSLGYQPVVPFAEGLQRTVGWLKDHIHTDAEVVAVGN